MNGTGSAASPLHTAGALDEQKAPTIHISPIEVLALKELSLVVRALAATIKDPRANKTLTQMLHVLVDVTGRADLANNVEGL